MPTSRQTTLTEVIEAFISSRLGDTYHILPGIVQTYYPATQEADIQIAINDPRFEPDTDALETEPWPLYPRMRVSWPRFGGYTIMGPLNPGDSVQVFFQDLDDSAFRATGQASDPPRTRRFGSDSAFCVPFGVADKDIATDAAEASSALILGKDGAPQQIQVNGTTIDIGKGATDFVALAAKIDLFIQTVMAWTPNAGDGGAALKAALTAAHFDVHTTTAATIARAK